MHSPGLNNWTSLFLIAAGLGLFVAVMLCLKAKDKRINLFPAFITLAFSMLLVQYVLFWSRYMFEFPHFILLPEMLLYAIPPTICWFARVKRGTTIHPAWSLTYLPAVGVLVLNMCYWTGVFSWADYDTNNLSALVLGLKSLMDWRLIVLMFISAIILIFRWQMKNPHYNPKVQEFNKMMRSLAAFLSVFTLAYTSYYVLIRFPFFNLEWDYAISVVMSAGIYLTAGVMYLNPGLLEDDLANGNAMAEKSALLSPSASLEIFEEVCRALEVEKLHHNEDLRVESLAAKLDLPRHYVSYAINLHSGQNFNRFINDYRLTDAENLLEENPEMSIKGIYFEVGFNNKATFYQVFKEKHGCTPSQFRNRHSMNSV